MILAYLFSIVFLLTPFESPFAQAPNIADKQKGNESKVSNSENMIEIIITNKQLFTSKQVQNMIDSPAIDSFTLNRIAQGVQNSTTTIKELDKILQKLLDAPKATGETYDQVALVLGKSKTPIENAEKMRLQIINSRYSESRTVAYTIGHSSTPIPHASGILQKIIDTRYMDEEALLQARNTLKNSIVPIANADKMLKQLDEHQKEREKLTQTPIDKYYQAGVKEEANGNLILAVEFYVKACNANAVEACYKLGLLKEKSGDIPAAKVHYQAVCSKGYKLGCDRLAVADQLQKKINDDQKDSVINATTNPIPSQLRSGGAHNCVIINEGVQCWGDNSLGELGNNSTISSATPVVAIKHNSGVTALAAGGGNTCAIVKGAVKCWGLNFDTRLYNLGGFLTLFPMNIAGLTSGVTAIAVGESHACAVVKGGVKCWGKNENSALGNNSKTDSPVPVQVQWLPENSGVTTIAAGYQFTCVIINGGVKCWGGGLGYPNSLTSIPELTTGVTAIKAGFQHACAIINGGVKCWGSNFANGKLGAIKKFSKAESWFHVPVSISPELDKGVLALGGGQHHSCASVNKGVTCWGFKGNGDSRPGHNISSSDESPVRIQGINSAAAEISGGGAHTCVLTDGKVFCWGIQNVSPELVTGFK